MAKVIASDLEAAWEAISGIKNVQADNGRELHIYSNVRGMLNGNKANFLFMPDLRKLVECVQMQAEKFLTLAETNEQRDHDDASSFNSINSK